MKKSKLLPRIISFFCIAIFLSACTKVSTTEQNKSNKNLKGSIKIYADQCDSEYLKTAVSSFQTKYNNTKIEVTTLGEEELINKYIENYGKEQQGDIVVLKEEKIQEALSKYEEKFLELDATDIEDKSNLIDDKYKNLMFDNGQYGVPWYVNPVGILYRKDILASLNINSEEIKTWQDYLKIGDTLNAVKSPNFSSININSMNKVTLTMLQQLATNFISDDKVVLNSDNILKIGSTIKTLLEKGTAIKVSSDEEELSNFINGKTTSIIATCTDLKRIEDSAPELKDKLQFEKVPAFENGGNRDASIRGSGILINKDSNNKELAIAFMNYLSSDYKSMKELYQKYRVMPAHYIMYVSDEFSGNDEYYGDKVFEEEIVSFKNTYNYTYTSQYELIRKVFVDSIKASIDSKEDMKLNLDKLQNNISDIIIKASAK